MPLSANFITEGWTKKEWALNLMPLGGIASVAYEIGSACLSSTDRTAKISKDFFKSPVQTTLKKIAQCLWVPIVICGALKLICLIVTTCWNRCFPPATNLNQNPSEVLPNELMLNIFSRLNLHDLAVVCRVSKQWNTIASDPFLWRAVNC